MAKGLEDTAFYRYNRLVSLNEVGADPTKFGVSIEEFHRANQDRMRCWPHSVLASSTHDSKRSEDVRARINVLSEIPAQWRASLRRWRDRNRSKKTNLEGTPAPDRNDEYLLYETLVGAWPLGELDSANWEKFVDRIRQYMFKAIREAKEFSRWANPNVQYENAMNDFTRAVLTRKRRNRFLDDFQQFQSRISRIGLFNSLSQTLLKLTCPGVPDVYQGNELWDFSLVDPDNRRPVDYTRRQQLLQEMLSWDEESDCEPGCRARSLLNSLEDGRAKLFLIFKALRFRREHVTLFQQGGYIPLTAHGPAANHLCAFARHLGRQVALVVAPRLCATLLGEKKQLPLGTEVWEQTYLEIPSEIEAMDFQDVLTGVLLSVAKHEGRRLLPADRILRNFPVALLGASAGT